MSLMSAAPQKQPVYAGILMRVSSPGQEDGYSLAEQEKDCRAHAERVDFIIQPQHVWNDGAQASYTLNRPGLNAAIEAIRNGEISVLLVGRYDRFSRIQLQQAVALHQIEKMYGGRVESANAAEQFGRDSLGTFLRSVAAYRAESELELIRDRTQGGRRARARSGKLIPSKYPLYGYLWLDPESRRGKTRYIEDPATAPVVRLIFDRALTGIPLRQIAKMLNREGVPCPAERVLAMGLSAPGNYGGRGWTGATIQGLMKHPAYCGKLAAYRTKTTETSRKDEMTGQVKTFKVKSLRASEDPDFVPLSSDVCPALVSEEVWNQAN
jgi:DNA invertase Pin-like site-specific DNA recombinase